MTIGSSGNKKVGNEDIQIRFPHDENGTVDIKNGKYNTHVEKKMCVKYSDEMQLAFGVAVVEKLDGTREGRRCEMIDYTGKIIVSQNDYKKKQKEEIYQVKALTGQKSHGMYQHIQMIMMHHKFGIMIPLIF